jgi:glucose-1-phosphate cytidylyltransferase
MKVVLLCGGLGTRLSEETQLRPKPMVQIGGFPILWHIMNIYGASGFSDFVLALGYKGEMVKEFFLNYHALNSDFKIDVSTGKISYSKSNPRNWSVECVDTGANSLTGGRLLRLHENLKNEKTFMLSYGDGVANVDLKKLLEFHKSHGKIATVTAVRPPARFGEMIFEGERVNAFKEKPQTGTGWINGGFFIFNSEIFNFLKDDSTVLEAHPLENLAEQGQLMGYKHTGFWQCMDTIRDKHLLEEYWNSNQAPWKVWN